jgi:sec-independent protein translocase protein TatA
MGSLSPMHWIVFLLVVLLLFGPARLANIGKGLGEGIRNFKKGLDTPENPDEAKNPAQLPGQKDAPRPGESSVSSDRRAV